MDAATRKARAGQARIFDPRIGHPLKYIDYSSLKVDRGDLLGNAFAVRRVRMEAEAFPLSQAGRPQPVGHDCRRPTTPITIHRRTRSPSPRRSSSRPISIPTPTRPPITAASARPSATKSGTASTTRAASSTAPAGFATGGPATAAKIRCSRTGAGEAISTVTSRFPACTSRAS